MYGGDYLTEYIVNTDDEKLHFYRTQKGELVMERKNGQKKILFYPIERPFSVMIRKKHPPEVLCFSKNRIIYINSKTGDNFTVAHTNKGLNLKRLHCFYESETPFFLGSAEYQGELLLIMSPLSDKAQPKTIAKLSHPDFFLHKNRLYYSESGGMLGYSEFSKLASGEFNSLIFGAVSPFVITTDGKDYMVAKKDSNILFQNRTVCQDEYAKNPIIASTPTELILSWKSRGYVRYIKSTDGGKSWSDVAQLMSAGKETPLFVNITPESYALTYLKEKLPTVQMQTEASVAKDLLSELESQRSELERIKKEIASLKNRTTRTDFF